MAILAALGVLVCLALPGLANSRSRSERVICVNNLRQIGQAFQTWATDHGDMNPWWLFNPGTSDGGTRGHPLDAQVWFQFSWVSNELDTPKILACPADAEVRTAANWTDSPIDGFLDPSFRANAVSYFLGLHALPDYPQSILGGDRNLTVNTLGGNCETGIRNTQSLTFPYARNAWTESLHGRVGNLLLTSGSVLETSPPALQSALMEATPPFSALHALFPRPPQLTPSP